MKKLAVVAFAAALLAACGEKDGSQFIGTYEANEGSVRRELVIERNGDSFVFKRTATSAFGGLDVATRPAVYKDGLLQIQVGTGTVAASYIKDRDVLLFDNREYKRVNK